MSDSGGVCSAELNRRREISTPEMSDSGGVVSAEPNRRRVMSPSKMADSGGICSAGGLSPPNRRKEMSPPNRRREMSDSDGPAKCVYCRGKINHGTSSCFIKRTSICDGCGERGHMAFECSSPSDYYARRGDYHTYDPYASCLKLTNLPPDVSKADLILLFSTYGPLRTVVLDPRREWSFARRECSFAFVRFLNRADAVDALAALNGFLYHDTPLVVEWVVKV